MVKCILYIYIVCMYLNCVLSSAVFEIAVSFAKIQRYSQLMEGPRKNSSVWKQPCHHKYKENFNISCSLIFFNNDFCFQTKLQHNYSEKNNERHYTTPREMQMTSVIRLVRLKLQLYI